MSLQSIEKYLESPTDRQDKSSKRALPPVDKWTPQKCGAIDLTIKANGEWWYGGKPMSRQALVDLFATVLWYEDDQYYLKTPVEQVQIEVEDAPFFVNDVCLVKDEGNDNNNSKSDKQVNEASYWIECKTTTGDVIRLDDDHPLFFAEYKQELRPYIPVRFGMNALIMRHVFYHLVELGELQEVHNEVHNIEDNQIEEHKENDAEVKYKDKGQQTSTVLKLQSGGKSYQLQMD